MSDGEGVASAVQPHDNDKYSALETDALKWAQESTTFDDKAKSVETLKNLADARNSYQAIRMQRLQLIVTTVAAGVPLLAILVTIIVTAMTLANQNEQFNTTLREQRQQSEKAATLQRNASEDAQWREAMKAVSFNDSSRALAAAMWMESFFNSPQPQYRTLSRRVTVSLLPIVDNVSGFDAVLTDLVVHTDSENQIDIIDIAQKISNIQWSHFGSRPDDPSQLPFVKEEVQGLEFVHKGGRRPDSQTGYAIGAWELDTASQALWRIWVERKASPTKVHQLGGLILENTGKGQSFSADFTDVSFRNGVLSNVSFHGANLTGANLTNMVILHNVDLSGITQFDRSDWKDTRWWRAQKISPELCKYLGAKFAPPKGTNLPSGCQP